MDIQAFEALHGKVWCKGLRDNMFHRDLWEGMLQFTDDTHSVLAGSFHGFGYFRTSLFHNIPHPVSKEPTLRSLADDIQQNRYRHFLMPARFGYKDQAQSEEHLQKRLALLTPKERKEWDKQVADHQVDYATIEKPYRLYICGNDDASYSKFFATEAAMNEELALYEACQPIHFFNDLLGFVFTN